MAAERGTTGPRVLYLDAHDPFSNTLIAQIEQCTHARVVKCPIGSDPASWGCPSPAPTFGDFAQGFDAIVAGPGPGWANRDDDAGWLKELWRFHKSHSVPVLAIGLGFHSLCLEFGAHLEPLPEPRHGHVAEVLHCGSSIFREVQELNAAQYNALQVMLYHRIQTAKAVRYPKELWEPTEACPELQPLAWNFDGKRNGAVLMATKHISKPLWGLQFHPESYGTNTEGTRIIENWWQDAQEWKESQKHSASLELDTGSTSPRYNEPLPCFMAEALVARLLSDHQIKFDESPTVDVQCVTTGSGRLAVADVVEMFEGSRGETIVLESGLQRDLLPLATGTGRHSVIGLVIPEETKRIHYYASKQTMQLRDGKNRVLEEWSTREPWQWIRDIMTQLQKCLGEKPKQPTWAPFWGGFMGYASCEAGSEILGAVSKEKAAYSDICFAYITRSIVIDHQLKKVYVQSIHSPDDSYWLNETLEHVYDAVGRKSLESTPNPTPLPKLNPFDQDATLRDYLACCTQPTVDRDEYLAAVKACQSHAAFGHAYHVNLATTSDILARRPRICMLSHTEANELSWKLYKGLASQNPAPFSAYMRLHNVHLLSASPSRCISWDRQQIAQCRPAHCTFQKHPDLSVAPPSDYLVVVDLARDLLHAVYGPGNVHVRNPVELEDHASFYQLTSVLEGIPASLSLRNVSEPPDTWHDASPAHEDKPSFSPTTYQGFDALLHALPSITASEHLNVSLLPSPPRNGISSGVIGYLDIAGGGDFALLSRSAVKFDPASSHTSSPEDFWSVAATTRVTVTTSPETALDEVLQEVESVGRAFRTKKAEEAQQEAGKELRGMWRRLMEEVEVEEVGDDDEDGGEVGGGTGEGGGGAVAASELQSWRNFEAFMAELTRLNRADGDL